MFEKIKIGFNMTVADKTMCGKFTIINCENEGSKLILEEPQGL